MWCHGSKYRRSAELFLFLSFLFLNNSLYAQNADSLIKRVTPPPSVRIDISFPGTYQTTGFSLKFPPSPLPSRIRIDQNTPVFFDSLKNKASKKLVTRRLYDLLIVTRDPAIKSETSGSSDKDYLVHAGKKIRNIDIRPLSVFGSSISNPLAASPGRFEKLLNKTHISTSEIIIRNNLLFKENDTVSPLILSDNERILRQLPYIDDARIIIVPVSDDEADIIVFTKDVYSLGADGEFSGIDKWGASVFEKNTFGAGHELRLEMEYDEHFEDKTGLGLKYSINNLAKSFTDLNLFYFNGLDKKTYGFDLSKKFLSATTKYGGGISVRQMYTTEDLDTMAAPSPLAYNLQDYWFGRSFLIDQDNASRVFFGLRYTNNNVFDRPYILPDSYYYLQKYRIFLSSVSLSMQKFYKTNLLYNYGRTEDVPYGGIINLTTGREINEFKERHYLGLLFSMGSSLGRLGYFYTSAGVSTFINSGQTEQGLLLLRTNYFSNLKYLGSNRIRYFAKIDYTRGFDRYSDERLFFVRENGFSGFRNDSTGGAQRLAINIETVIFSHRNLYGFRFAFFGYADASVLFGTNEFVHQGEVLSSLGIGVRVRNDNLVFNTFQIRIGFFPNLPEYSKINYLLFSGEQLLKPSTFDPGPPSLLPYR